MDKITIAGTAGIHLLDRIGNLQDAVLTGKLVLLAPGVQPDDLCPGEIRRSHSQFLCHTDIRNFVHRILHQMAGIGVHKDWIRRRHHTVAHHGVAALLKVQVSADVIHDDKILVDPFLQMSDRFMQPQTVKTALFRIRDQAFHVLQGTGHPCLAMPLHNRNIDQEIYAVHDIRDIQFHSRAVFLMPLFLLRIDKRNTVFFRQSIIAAVVKSVCRAVSDPGALCDDDPGKAVLLQIFYDAGNNFRMCRPAKLSR